MTSIISAINNLIENNCATYIGRKYLNDYYKQDISVLDSIFFIETNILKPLTISTKSDEICRELKCFVSYYFVTDANFVTKMPTSCLC